MLSIALSPSAPRNAQKFGGWVGIEWAWVLDLMGGCWVNRRIDGNESDRWVGWKWSVWSGLMISIGSEDNGADGWKKTTWSMCRLVGFSCTCSWVSSKKYGGRKEWMNWVVCCIYWVGE